MPDAARGVGDLLTEWQTGDKKALRLQSPLIYGNLHRLAHRHLREERPDHTVQTTAVVHEAYLCLERHEMSGEART